MALLFQKKTNYFAFIFVLLLATTSHASKLLPEFIAYEEQYHNVLDTPLHTILSSSPKRISNAIVIDSQSEVAGVRENRLISIPRRYETKEIFEFYLGELMNQSENVYQCRKRSCGSSNYWANEFFEERRLYGRDSEQFFISGKLKSSSLDVWYMIYIVRNGLKQNLVYITTVKEDSEGKGFENGMLYFDPLSPAALEDIKTTMEKEEVTDLWLVAYSDDSNGMNASRELERLTVDAEKKRLSLASALNEGKYRVRSVVVGPFHGEVVLGRDGYWYRLFLSK